MTDAPETFEEWMERVDAALLRKYGITHDDLVDQTWRDWYDDDLSPAEAVEMIGGTDGILGI